MGSAESLGFSTNKPRSPKMEKTRTEKIVATS